MTSNKIQQIVLSAGICLLTLTVAAIGQKATPTPTPKPAATTSQKALPTPTPVPADENYTISSSIEVGVRGLSVNGNNEKFRSDLNYRPGLRLFDSSFLIDSKKGEQFDHALFQSSGWGSDPSGFFRGNIDKSGLYKFSSTVRKNNYYNDLLNFAPTWSQAVSTGSQHRFDTRRNLGDFDLTLFPDSEKLRMRFGYSYNRNEGPGMYNMRWPAFSSSTGSNIRGEEYNVLTKWGSNSDDLRMGVEGKLLGFNMGVNYGYRQFHDGTTFYIPTTNVGNDPGATTSTASFYNRDYRTRGTTNYLNFFIQRTFAEKFDFTGRLIYSVAKADVNETDLGVGRTSSANTAAVILLDADTIGVTGLTKRPQTRADVGFTYRASGKLRISNTFSFDQFNGSGGNLFLEDLISRNGLGVGRPADHGYLSAWRATSYHKYTNYVEADFDLSRKISFNGGYRYSHRSEVVNGFDIAATGILTPTLDSGSNHTNAFIAGLRLKPTKRWGLFFDGEIGQADSVFTRTENNRYKFFRMRSITRFNKWTLNVSAIVRNNKNPGFSEDILSGTTVIFPAREADANSRIRNISTSFDWTPNDKLSFSIGHTYDHQTSKVDVIVPVGAPIFTSTQWFIGNSQYFVRDNFFFFDVTAHPMDRVTLYASYRIDNDSGQGRMQVTRPQDFISSYPMRFQSPEVKVSIKLNHRMDWDIGYKYYAYRENLIYNPFAYTTVITGNQTYPAQNYWAHMPYTSLRIYFGRSADARR